MESRALGTRYHKGMDKNILDACIQYMIESTDRVYELHNVDTIQSMYIELMRFSKVASKKKASRGEERYPQATCSAKW